MPKPENINSRNIKYLEIANHNGDIETYIKSSNKWYHISHMQGSIEELNKLSFNQIDNIISQTLDSKHYRIFEQGDWDKYFNTSIPPSMESVYYDITTGNPKFYYGEEDKYEVTFRQIVRNYTKLKRKIQY